MDDETDMNGENPELRDNQLLAEKIEWGAREFTGLSRWIVPVLAVSWSVFQLLTAAVLLLDATLIRSIHLAFAISLVYLTHPIFKKSGKSPLMKHLSNNDRYRIPDYFFAFTAAAAALYLAIDYFGLTSRQGSPAVRDLVIGFALVVLLLEAVRRAIGPVLPLVVCAFIFYGFFGPYLPSFLAFKGVSVSRFIGQITMSTEGIYGVPLDVSATIVFLFVLFGSLLDKAGAGKYFVDLAFSLLGPFKGGPAKAAVLASALTGMVSGSSIANTVTTGRFTIPLMKSVGYPPYKAGAVEVACSTNGQFMPPIMGAAAFIIAGYCNIEYFEVIKAALIPAVISFISLMYIAHLEASKLGIKGVPKENLPAFYPTFFKGIHFLIPLAFLIVELVVLKHSPALAAFRAILSLFILIPVQNIIKAVYYKKSVKNAILKSLYQLWSALESCGKNMMGIGVAVASAGIIVGLVTLGLGEIITQVIEVLSGGNFTLILVITAIACLILGMGLPTTATYIVMASLTAPVIVTLGAKSGLFFPLIAVHLFVFFFGILADDTPPVGLAALAAAAIAKADPVKTGLQGFSYDIRTAVLPFMFLFNTDLLLMGIDNVFHGLWIFFTALAAMMAFAALTQNFFLLRNRWYESILLAIVTFTLLRPDLLSVYFGSTSLSRFLIGLGALVLWGCIFLLQRERVKAISV
ncbi:MAG: TRAP transporter permease [Spirochaetaceae bacterium]|nr:TRAP transporter permease [Spirochaetaceae bacterium]